MINQQLKSLSSKKLKNSIFYFRPKTLQMVSKNFKIKELHLNLPKPLKSKSIFKLTIKLMGKVRKNIITTTVQLS